MKLINSLKIFLTTKLINNIGLFMARLEKNSAKLADELESIEKYLEIRNMTKEDRKDIHNFAIRTSKEILEGDLDEPSR